MDLTYNRVPVNHKNLTNPRHTYFKQINAIHRYNHGGGYSPVGPTPQPINPFLPHNTYRRKTRSPKRKTSSPRRKTRSPKRKTNSPKRKINK